MQMNSALHFWILYWNILSPSQESLLGFRELFIAPLNNEMTLKLGPDSNVGRVKSCGSQLF